MSTPYTDSVFVPPNCAAIRINDSMTPTDVWSASRVAAEHDLALGLLAGSLAWIAVCVGMFELLRKRRARLYVRPRESLYGTVVGSLVFFLNNPIQILIGYSAYPCTATLVLSMLIVPIIGGAYVQKLAQFYFRTRFETSMLAANRASREGNVEGLLENEDEERSVAASSHANDGERGASLLRRAVNFAGMAATTLLLGTFTLFLFRDVIKTDAKNRRRALRQLRILESPTGGLIIVVGSVIPAVVFMLVVAGVQPVYAAANGCTGCGISNLMTGLLIVEAVGTIIFVAIVVFQIRDFPDPWGVIAEARVVVLTCSIAALGFILQQYAPIVVGYNHMFLLGVGLDLNIGAQTLLILWWSRNDGDADTRVAVATGSEMESRVVSVVGSSEATLTRGLSKGDALHRVEGEPQAHKKKMTLMDTLSDPIKCAVFEEYLVSELALESLMFYQQATRYREDFRGLNEATRRVRAKKLCRSFVQTSGLFAINVGADISRPLLKKVMDPATRFDGVDAAEIFEPARQEILRLLAGSFERYKLRVDKGEFLPTSPAVAPA